MRFLNYEAVAAVQQSLELAGFRNFRVSLAREATRWFRSDWLADFVETLDSRSVPLHWEGKPLVPHDALKPAGTGGPAGIVRQDRMDLWVVRGEVAVAWIVVLGATGSEIPLALVGENRRGALAAFMEDYCTYARKRGKEEAVILSPDDVSLPRLTNLEWDSLTLPPALERDLRHELDAFFSGREVYRSLGVPYRRGFLFAGPPGNGKTSLLKVIASRYRVPFILVNSMLGNQTYFLNRAFTMAGFHAPAILCFEDVDSLFRNEVTLSHFLNRVDGLESLEGILLVATTNHPQVLDPALKDRPSRFDRIWMLPNPGPEERRRYLERQFGEAFDPRLVRSTEGFSFAHLKEVWLSACFAALRRGDPRPDLEAAEHSIRQLGSQRDRTERNGTAVVGFRR